MKKFTLEIDRKTFIDIMNAIKNEQESIKTFEKAVAIFIGGETCSLPPGVGERRLASLLERAMNDTKGLITYFMYDLNWGQAWKKGVVTHRGEDVRLQTIADLWNLLEKK